MQPITKEYLEEHVVRQESRGRKCICPLCNSPNMWDTSSENGRVYCFACATPFYSEGVLLDYAPPVPHPRIEEFRQYYRAVSNTYHGCIETEHEEYLKRRGLELKDIETFQLGFCPPSTLSLYDDPLAVESGVARTDRKPILDNRITFTYIGEGKATDLRGRIFRTDGMKYKGLFSSSIRRGAIFPFNWDRGLALAAKLKYLIITEGEMKAVLADTRGFPCIAMPGMTNWRPISLPAEWRLIILFDNSKLPMDRMRIDRAIERVHTKVPKALIGTLPLEKETKQDIDTFLLGKGDRVKWFQQIIDNALPYSRYAALRRF